MDFHRARRPSVPKNFAMMMTAACEGLDEGRRREMAAKLDPQEPVCGIERWREPDAGPGASVRGQLTMCSTLSALIRLGDRALIEGALGGERVHEPKAWVNSRDFQDSNEELAACALREALAMADPDTLALAASTFGEADKHAFERGARLLDGAGRDFGSALWGFAVHADAHDPGKVSACAKWLADSHDAFVESMYPIQRRGSKQATRERQEGVERAKQAGRTALLEAGLRCGSESVAKAALELGAKVDFRHAWEAFDNGAPALAARLWAIASRSLQEGKLDARGPEPFERQSRVDKDSKPASGEQRRGICVFKMGESLERLASRLGVRAAESAMFEERKAQIGSFVLGALMEAGKDQGASKLMAQAMALCHHFEAPAKWIRAARAAFPRPSAEELGALAKAGRWSLASARLKDAASAGVDADWLEEASEACRIGAEADLRSRDGLDRRSRERKSNQADGLWFVRLACELSAVDLGWSKGQRPVDALTRVSGFEPGEIAGAYARFEASKMEFESAAPKGSAKRPARI